MHGIFTIKDIVKRPARRTKMRMGFFAISFILFLLLTAPATQAKALNSADPDVLGNTVTSTLDPGGKTSATRMNEHLLTYTTLAGVVVAVLGVIKLIMSMSDHSPMGKVTATSMIALGIALVAGSQLIDVVGKIDDNASEKDRAMPVIKWFMDALFWPGVIIIVIGVFKNIMAIMHERPEEKVDAGKMVGAGIGLTAATYIGGKIVDAVFDDKTKAAENVAGVVLYDVVCPIMVIVGGILIMLGLFNFAQAFKDENSEGKVRAGVMLTVGVLLGIATAIAQAVSGIAPT